MELMRWTMILLVLLTASSSLAQSGGAIDWNNQSDPLGNAVGIHWGEIGGNGLSFRMPIQWYLYLQVAGGIWHTEHDEKHNLGVNINYILRQDDRLRLYLSAGMAHFTHNEVEDEAAESEVWNKENNLNIGAGVGLEYLVGKRWAVKMDLDFAHTEDDGNTTVIPQLGMHFYW